VAASCSVRTPMTPVRNSRTSDSAESHPAKPGIIKHTRKENLPLSLELSLSVLALASFYAVLWLALVLDVLVIDVDSLANLGIKSFGVGKTTQMN
jgi:hypothetical protein